MNVEFVRLLTLFIPLCTIAASLLIWVIRTKPANKTADEAIADGQYKRLLAWANKMEARCALSEARIDVLEAELAVCHRERDDALARAIKAEAASEGIGIVRTAQAIADAEKRQKDKGKQ